MNTSEIRHKMHEHFQWFARDHNAHKGYWDEPIPKIEKELRSHIFDCLSCAASMSTTLDDMVQEREDREEASKRFQEHAPLTAAGRGEVPAGEGA